jgi:hypothetical protein
MHSTTHRHDGGQSAETAGASASVVNDADRRQLRRYLTGETTCCACGATLACGAARCPNPRCGVCSDCGARSCYAAACSYAREARFQVYLLRVAPLAHVARLVGVVKAPVAEIRRAS